MSRYREIAEDILHKIEEGEFGTGDKLPSIRQAESIWNASLITIKAAYRYLEKHHVIAAKAQSGFYVLERKVQEQPAAYADIPVDTQPREELKMIHTLLRPKSSEVLASLGAAIPGADLLPLRTLGRLSSRVARNSFLSLAEYTSPAGLLPLREEIAKYYRTLGAKVLPTDIVIHEGALNAILTSLQTITKAGDTIILERPTYYLFMHAAAMLQLKVMTVPHIPGIGVDLKALARALRSKSVRAILLMPNFHNPTGTLSSDAHKEALLQLVKKYDTYIIEDDVYGDIHFEGDRPKPLLCYGRADKVIYCSSITKTLSPALRVGWSISRSLQKRIEETRFLSSITSSTLAQQVVTEFFSSEGYARHCRKLSMHLAEQGLAYPALLEKILPVGSRISRPQGGFLLWVELPKGNNTTELFHKLLHRGAVISPGVLFGNHREAKRFFRVSFGSPLSGEVERGIRIIGNVLSK